MRVSRTFGFLLATIIVTVAPARAQWVVSPYLGLNVAGDLEQRRGGAGVSVDYFGGWWGAEIDVERHGHFFKDAEIGNVSANRSVDVNTRATRVMGNVMVPLWRQSAGRWYPFVVAGAGLIRPSFIHEGPDQDVHQNHPAISVGAGVIKSLSSRIGLRGDLRYFRAFAADQDVPLGPGQRGDANGVYRNYGFLQLTLGITFGVPR